MRRLTVLVAVVALALVAMAGPAGAHQQTVDPPGEGEGFGPRPISQLWAQAHCNAQSPAIVFERSGGVVDFQPRGALPCLDIWVNPGGQVHPHAVPPGE